MKLTFDPRSSADYTRFLRARRLPTYRVRGSMIEIPDEYAGRLGMVPPTEHAVDWQPHPSLFDYQRDIAELAIRKRKFAVFADCGLGKTLILLEFARHVASTGRRVLIVCPLMVAPQTSAESERWYGEPLEIVPAASLQDWLDGDGPAVALTNYEAIRDGLTPGKLGALVLDESSMLKSHYGKFGRRLIELGRGLDYKLALTGTPAPNDRIEYANHAVLLDQHRTVNEFLARYFINRGETQNRWELKPHALRPFYRDLSNWCIFLTDPAVYGWRPIGKLPPIKIHIENIALTDEQRAAVQDLTGGMFVTSAGGIGQRSKLSQIAKGRYGDREVATDKFSAIRRLVESWPEEGTIIWARFNDEQDRLAREFPEAVSITGSTKYERRLAGIEAFKSGNRQVLISKPEILGFGLNLQCATRQVFSSCDDSYESFYQAVKRSNRIGSSRPLNVHIAVTELEEPMVQNVLRKAHRVEADAKEQETLFREVGFQWN